MKLLIDMLKEQIEIYEGILDHVEYEEFDEAESSMIDVNMLRMKILEKIEKAHEEKGSPV